jgi:hypothetical protein
MSYGIKLVGSEWGNFPWAVVNEEGKVVERYSHRAVADQAADRLNLREQGVVNDGNDVYEFDEIDEMLANV